MLMNLLETKYLFLSFQSTPFTDWDFQLPTGCRNHFRLVGAADEER
jgi:hypothetical protein